MRYPEEVAGLVLLHDAFLPEAKGEGAARVATEDLQSVDSPPVVLSITPAILSPEDEPGILFDLGGCH
jgi:hypothetical protein